MADEQKQPLLNARLRAFFLHSLFKDYGNAFILKITLAHPIQTIGGLFRYLSSRKESPDPKSNLSGRWEGGASALVGMGFCLKPLEPACISGRPNHDCLYFEKKLFLLSSPPPECCRICMIREAGLLALRSGSHFYIMTSAQDILEDILIPSARRNTFSRALLGICPYSIEPFRIALSICGVKSLIFPYGEGDCRDYRTWRLADKGIKKDRTRFHSDVRNDLIQILDSASLPRPDPESQFRKKGNIFYFND